MNYVQFHIGDWISDTDTLTASERGIYIDLVMRYYKNEGPLSDDLCKRIARAYANAEQEDMHYVLQNFFTYHAGAWHHKRCDEEIEKALSVSTKRKRAAEARWSKKEANAKQEQCTCNANADANAMLTINHKPIVDSRVLRLESAAENSAQIPVPSSGFISEVLQEVQAIDEERPIIPNKPRKATTHKFTMDSMPDDWKDFCEQVRPDLDPQTTFASFRAYFTTGNGSDKLRSDKGWNQSWQSWVKKEKALTQAPAKKQASRFARYCNPDWNQNIPDEDFD